MLVRNFDWFMCSFPNENCNVEIYNVGYMFILVVCGCAGGVYNQGCHIIGGGVRPKTIKPESVMDRPTDGWANGLTKRGVESRSMRLITIVMISRGLMAYAVLVVDI